MKERIKEGQVNRTEDSKNKERKTMESEGKKGRKERKRGREGKRGEERGREGESENVGKNRRIVFTALMKYTGWPRKNATLAINNFKKTRNRI